jgi:hypothetical protein
MTSTDSRAFFQWDELDVELKGYPFATITAARSMEAGMTVKEAADVLRDELKRDSRAFFLKSDEAVLNTIQDLDRPHPAEEGACDKRYSLYCFQKKATDLFPSTRWLAALCTRSACRG